jgi:hypothetical protein
MTNIIAAMTNHTVTTIMMRPISAPPSLTLGRDSSAPPKSADATTLARGDEFPMNFVPFRALFLANFREFNSIKAKFAEFYFHALR